MFQTNNCIWHIINSVPIEGAENHHNIDQENSFTHMLHQKRTRKNMSHVLKGSDGI